MDMRKVQTDGDDVMMQSSSLNCGSKQTSSSSAARIEKKKCIFGGRGFDSGREWGVRWDCVRDSTITSLYPA
jgi:hypothetical protein